jgi:hypothetical protein
MGRVSPAFLPVGFLVAWVSGAARAHADPIRVTSGQFNAFAFLGEAVPGGDSIFAPDLSGRALATASTLSFAASPTQVVCHDNAFRGIVCGGVAPFTFNASLMFGGGPTTVDLIGAGTVESEFFGNGVRLNYVFEARPTPEPATVSLLTTGLIMGGAGILRRRRAGGART